MPPIAVRFDRDAVPRNSEVHHSHGPAPILHRVLKSRARQSGSLQQAKHPGFEHALRHTIALPRVQQTTHHSDAASTTASRYV